jgi:hypothetical protein
VAVDPPPDEPFVGPRDDGLESEVGSVHAAVRRSAANGAK